MGLQVHVLIASLCILEQGQAALDAFLSCVWKEAWCWRHKCYCMQGCGHNGKASQLGDCGTNWGANGDTCGSHEVARVPVCLRRENVTFCIQCTSGSGSMLTYTGLQGFACMEIRGIFVNRVLLGMTRSCVHRLAFHAVVVGSPSRVRATCGFPCVCHSPTWTGFDFAMRCHPVSRSLQRSYVVYTTCCMLLPTT